MTRLPLLLPLLLALLFPLSLSLPLPGARLLIRAPPPSPSLNSWASSYHTWYSGTSSSSPSVPLSGITHVCPADYPMGFTVVCDPGASNSRRAVFRVAGRTVKVARRSWFGPYEVEGHFRGGSVVWEGFAFGHTVTCKLGRGRRVRATIKVAC